MKDLWRFFRHLGANLREAVGAMAAGRVRAALTVAIIAIGMMSLVGIETAVSALTGEVMRSFSRFGADSFIIKPDYGRSDAAADAALAGDARSRVLNDEELTYEQVTLFKQNYFTPATASVYAFALDDCIISHGSRQTSPTMQVIGVDEDYLAVVQGTVEWGRAVGPGDLASGDAVCVVGKNVCDALFGEENPVGRFVSVRGARLRVIGSTARYGSLFGGGLDDIVMVPLTCARRQYTASALSYRLWVMPSEGVSVEEAASAAEELMRRIRRLSATDATDFSVSVSAAMARQLDSLTAILSLTAMVIGLLTLLGAAVGLMNIMLVAVKERTREIGLKKAIGATPAEIRLSFLTESALLGLTGGLAGSLLGLLAGNVTALFLDVTPAFPWKWLIAAAALSLAVSLASGYLPARRAAALDCVDSLRYE